MSESWLAIVNPAAGGGRCAELADGALEDLRRAGIAIEQVRTEAPGDATRLARDAYEAGLRRFVAVGGDGTGYELINGLLPEALESAEGARPCVAFLPLGTGNSFMRDFGVGGPERVVEALRAGQRRPCDVVRLTHDGGELYFINLLSVGFVADVCTTANRRFKRLGTAGYALSVVLETAGLAPQVFRMRMDGGAGWGQPTTFVSFCNSRYTGGTMMMAPFADTSDGKLDVIIAGAMSRVGLLAAFPRIFAGTHVHMPSVACSQATCVEIDAEAPMDLMIDGEVERHRPLRLDIVPSAIDVSV